MLIVEDETTSLEIMKDYFASAGYQVDGTETLDGASRLLSAGGYDVLITDVRLAGRPNRDGLRVARLAKRVHGATRVVVLTAYDSPQARAEATALGVEALFVKPTPLPEIARLLLEVSRKGG